MSRSTFSILPYINRQKVKADGTANILCRITVDGKSAAISTGISCTPQEWNAKKGEVRNARDNGRLASFLAEVKDRNCTLTISVRTPRVGSSSARKERRQAWSSSCRSIR